VLKDHQIVHARIDRYGEPPAGRLFSNQVVDRARSASPGSGT
jgi:hypothetical protein